MTPLLILIALCIGGLVALYGYALCRTSALADRAMEEHARELAVDDPNGEEK